MDTPLKQLQQSAWSICKRAFLFIFYEAPVFCVKNWLLVVSTLLVSVGLDYLEIFIDPQSYYGTIISIKTLCIRLFFSIICTASITMIFVRFIQYFFNNQLSTPSGGIEWTQRETSTFILLLKLNLPYHLVYFILPQIVSKDILLIELVISIYYYIFLILAVIFSVFLDKTPIRSTLSSIKGRIWKIIKASLLYFPLILILFFKLGEVVADSPILSFKATQFVIAPLFISFVCSFFRNVLAAEMQYANLVNENPQVMDIFIRPPQTSSWNICKRALSFFFREIPVFCVKNWLLVVLTILGAFGQDYLEKFIRLYFFKTSATFQIDPAFINVIFSPIYTVILTMILVRLIQYFFNNQVQMGKYWGVLWSKRETASFITLLKFILLFQLVHFIWISTLPSEAFVWFNSRIGVWIWNYAYIIMAFALIFSISLDKKPVRSALSCVKGKIWKIFKALFLFVLTCILPIMIPLFLFLIKGDVSLSTEIEKESSGYLVFMIAIFMPLLFISFCCSLFQGIVSDDLKKRVMNGMYD